MKLFLLVFYFIVKRKNEWSRSVITRAKYFWNLPKFENVLRHDSNLGIITNILC